MILETAHLYIGERKRCAVLGRTDRNLSLLSTYCACVYRIYGKRAIAAGADLIFTTCAIAKACMRIESRSNERAATDQFESTARENF